MFEKYAPFTDHISEINITQVYNAKISWCSNANA